MSGPLEAALAALAQLDQAAGPHPELRVERRFVALAECVRSLAAALAVAQARISELERAGADESRRRRLTGKWTE